MKLTKSPPTLPTPLARVRPLRDMERLMDRFFQVPFFPDLPARAQEEDWAPTLDLSETPEQYLVRLEAPGFHRENLDVSLDGEFLTLSGNREFRADEKGENYLWQERREGRFARTVRLPGGVDPAKVEARYQDGVLTVTLMKTSPATQTRISIT